MERTKNIYGIFYYVKCFFVIKINFLFQNSFTEKLGRQYRESPYAPHPISHIASILRFQGIFHTTKKPTSVLYYELNSILYLDFTSFHLMSFFCSKTPSRTPHHIQSSCFLRLILAVAVSQTLFLMTSTFLRASGQVFCRMSPYWNWMFFSG